MLLDTLPRHLHIAGASTHTTFAPTMVRGGTAINMLPDRVTIDVDIRALPGVSPGEVDAMLVEGLGDLASRVEVQVLCAEEGSLTSFETPLGDRLALVASALVPGSRVVPRLAPGATDARHFRWRGVSAYGFGLHSPRIPAAEYARMFHGDDERIDVESLRLSARLWEALCRDFLA